MANRRSASRSVRRVELSTATFVTVVLAISAMSWVLSRGPGVMRRPSRGAWVMRSLLCPISEVGECQLAWDRSVIGILSVEAFAPPNPSLINTDLRRHKSGRWRNSDHQTSRSWSSLNERTERGTNLLKTTRRETRGHQQQKEIIVHWRGERVEGYSMQFRQLELSNALSAVLGLYETLPIDFTNALVYDRDDMPHVKKAIFEGALQYISLRHDDSHGFDFRSLPSDALIQAAQRCSLVRSVYEVVAEGDEYADLGRMAISNGVLNDMMEGGRNDGASWCIRLRQFGGASAKGKEQRFGKQTRSPLTQERDAIRAMAPLVRSFGPVRLQNPDIQLYVFEGLKGRKRIFARTLTDGPKTSLISPKTRICITNTPLCPIAAFSMCNIARIVDGESVLDPYCGSCTTLLAASMLAPTAKTVGIEIAHNGFVNRDDVMRDFSSRNLTPPAAVIQGDSTNKEVRHMARDAVGGDAFDVIVTDPPYGIREKMGSTESPPLVKLFASIAEDRQAGTPLLKKGGRLVAFVPVQEGEELGAALPNVEQMAYAGLKMTVSREQPLTDSLSRWLVAFSCVR